MPEHHRKTITDTFRIPFSLRATELPSSSLLPLVELPKNKIVMSVSIINWCREFNMIVSSIMSIIRQGFPVENYEIIIVDDASEPPYDKYIRDAVQFIIDTFPSVNLRAYFTDHTRSWRDPHVTNVALRKSFGEIFMFSYSDIVHIGETLMSAWVYHNEYENLFLMPMQVKPNLHTKSWQNIFPEGEHHGSGGHQYGASLLRYRMVDVCGLNETIIHEPSDCDFISALRDKGIVNGMDYEVAVSQPWSCVPVASSSRGKYPRINRTNRDASNKWTDDDKWGLLTSDEEAMTIYSNAMKDSIEKRKHRTGL